MNRLQRKFYLLFFTVLFFLTAPLLILFALGYRFDQNGRVFVHSGSITVKSWPQDIEIYLNGKKQEKKKLNTLNSSFTLNGIRPGKYLLSCKKDGYTNWEKTIQVKSGISTEFWNVILFPINPEIKKISQNKIDHFFLSPRNKGEVIYFSHTESERKIFLLDSKNNTTSEIYKTTELKFIDPKEGENVEWNTDNKRILIPFKTSAGNKNYVITNLQEQNPKNIIKISDLLTEAKIEAGIKNARWMFDKKDDLVVLTEDHRLYYINISNPQDTLLIADQVSAFNFAGNRIYYAQLPNNLVWEIQGNDIGTKRQITGRPIATLPKSFIKMFAYDEYRIALVTPEKTLYVFNEEKETGEVSLNTIASNVENVQFSDDGKKLLYWTENELWCLMLRTWKVQPLREKNEKIFITRFSEAIKNIQWMDNYENILFTIGSTVKSITLDGRDRLNMVDVLTLKSSADNHQVIYSKDDQTLYFIDPNEKYLNATLLINKGGILGLNF